LGGRSLWLFEQLTEEVTLPCYPPRKASVGASQLAKKLGFSDLLKGLGFSRADKPNQINGDSAEEGCLPWLLAAKGEFFRSLRRPYPSTQAGFGAGSAEALSFQNCLQLSLSSPAGVGGSFIG
jgi:hypothetical protein